MNGLFPIKDLKFHSTKDLVQERKPLFLCITACPPGSFLNSNNNEACEKCPLNTVSTSRNSRTCTACPPGTNTQQLTGQTSCGENYDWPIKTKLPWNKVEWSVKAFFCSKIYFTGLKFHFQLIGWIPKETKTSTSVLCVIGCNPFNFYFSVCPRGSFLNPERNNACDVCPMDTHTGALNAVSCMRCPLGTNTQGKSGQMAHTACGNNIFPSLQYEGIHSTISRKNCFCRLATGKSPAHRCALSCWAMRPWIKSDWTTPRPNEKIWTNHHLISVCPPGRFLNSAAGGNCEECPSDSFNSEINADSCTRCPAGTNTQQLRGQTSENSCSEYKGQTIRIGALKTTNLGFGSKLPLCEILIQKPQR